MGFNSAFIPLKAELNPICHLLALLGAHLIFHISRIRVKVLKLLKNPRERAFKQFKWPRPQCVINLVF